MKIESRRQARWYEDRMLGRLFVGTIDRWFVREIMFAYVSLCVSSTVVRDTLGPYRFWPGRSG